MRLTLLYGNAPSALADDFQYTRRGFTGGHTQTAQTPSIGVKKPECADRNVHFCVAHRSATINHANAPRPSSPIRCGCVCLRVAVRERNFKFITKSYPETQRRPAETKTAIGSKNIMFSLFTILIFDLLTQQRSNYTPTFLRFQRRRG